MIRNERDQRGGGRDSHATVQDLANGGQTALLCQLTIDCRHGVPASIFIGVRASRSRYVEEVEVLVTFDVSKFILEENDAVVLG